MDWIDTALYPELDTPPQQLLTVDDQADFIARMCGAWDFGIYPFPETITEVRKPEWREAVDRCQLHTSHTSYLLREWHGLSPLAYLGFVPAYIRDDPYLSQV